MGMGNTLVLSETTAYLLSFIFSFFTIIPVSVNLGEFNGHCLLYASGSWDVEEKEGSQLKDVVWGPSSACNFTIFIGVVAMLLSIVNIGFKSVHLMRGTESSWRETFVGSMISFLMVVVIFSTGLTVSVGFREWCVLLASPLSQIVSCSEGQTIPFGRNLNLTTTNYYTEFQMAQFGVWCTWICWVTLMTFGIVKLYQLHRLEAFTVSASRERQRLLQQVNPNPRVSEPL